VVGVVLVAVVPVWNQALLDHANCLVNQLTHQVWRTLMDKQPDKIKTCKLYDIVVRTLKIQQEIFEHNCGQKHVTSIDFTVLERQLHCRTHNILFIAITNSD